MGAYTISSGILHEHGGSRADCSSQLNGYLTFPHVAQVYKNEREITDKKSGERSLEIAYGVTSRCASDVSPEKILHIVRKHWSIEVSHYIIDWIYDEDRSTIRTGRGPENMTRRRRFAIGLVKPKGAKNISKQMRRLNKNTRSVLTYMKIVTNSPNPRTV